jgi:regulator of sigma E protease
MQIVQTAITIALFIVMLGVLVILHELGHFVMARLFRIRVHEFGVGFPPRAKVLRSKGETLYTLNWLPIGGFVRLEGEDGDSDDPRSFGMARLWKQLVVLVAGVGMNLLLAFVIFTGIAWLATPFTGVRFWTVDAASPAAAAGLKPGDAIVSIDGQRYEIFGSQGILDGIRSRAGQSVTLGVLRDGARIEVPVTLRSTAQIDDTHGALGISGRTKPFEEAYFGEYTGRPLGDAIALGIDQTGRAFGLILSGLGQLVSSIVSNPTQAPPVSGPIGIASMVGQVFWQAGPIMTLYLAAILSANLALVNILPFPPLDGGRVLVLLLKAILSRGGGLLRRVGIRVGGPSAATAVTAERLAYLVGFVFLFGFLIWISVFDIVRLGTGTTP